MAVGSCPPPVISSMASLARCTEGELRSQLICSCPSRSRVQSPSGGGGGGTAGSGRMAASTCGNLYTITEASGDATVGIPGGAEGIGTVLQGYTEQSNVSVVEEFINLIVAQRGYEANSKVVKAADEMYQQVNQLTQ